VWCSQDGPDDTANRMLGFMNGHPFEQSKIVARDYTELLSANHFQSSKHQLSHPLFRGVPEMLRNGSESGKESASYIILSECKVDSIRSIMNGNDESVKRAYINTAVRAITESIAKNKYDITTGLFVLLIDKLDYIPYGKIIAQRALSNLRNLKATGDDYPYAPHIKFTIGRLEKCLAH